ncbi:hypothetical protein BDZ45DRAFT_811630 [Acephala macrosclerotiorum]|nr:hypothetical protein BDZ45DRAFT_811630 [Acephala macrosclerotiorum]
MADLERHYKHANTFAKPSNHSTLHKENNANKDHYRDHLRDYHKEDIGCAK